MLFPLFSNLLERYHTNGNRVVLALSGGVDSRVLLDLLARYKAIKPSNEYLAIYVHHGLSDNADLWEKKCRTWCHDASIDFLVEKVTLNQGAGTSIEQEARDKRYKVLKRHITSCDTLLTGQHQGDQLETFLLAMKRGSGPKGLSSMPERCLFGEGQLLRPLLHISQEEIMSYASQHQLDWVEDESNRDTKFDRNFLRHNVIPTLKERWPHIEKTVARSAHLCADQEALLSELLSEKLRTLMSDDKSISIQGLAEQSVRARNQLLRLWVSQSRWLMPSQQQLDKIWNEVALAKEDANPVLSLSTGEVRRFKKRMYLVSKYENISGWRCNLRPNEAISLPDGLGIFELKSSASRSGTMRMPKPDEQIWVSFEPSSLTAHPVERGHSRSLKKLYQEYGVPSWLRRRTPILIVNDRVAAVVGLFIDKAFSGNECELVWVKNEPTL